MSVHEEQDTDDGYAADLAGTGSERETSTPRGGVEAHDRLDDDETGLARAGEPQVVSKEDGDGVEHVDVDADSTVSASVRSIARSIEYWGPLPIASEMNLYDEKTRETILRMHELQVTSAVSREGAMVEFAIESDRRQADREDRLANADMEQSKTAQRWTALINLALIVAAIIVSCLGHEAVGIALVGALAVVNVSTLFVPLGKRRRGLEEHTTNDPEK